MADLTLAEAQGLIQVLKRILQEGQARSSEKWKHCKV